MKKNTVYLLILICLLLTLFVVSCDDNNEIIDYDAEFYVEDGEVVLNFALPERTYVALQTRNSNGQINTIVDAELNAGYWGLYWSKNQHPESFTAGTCFIEFVAGDYSDTKTVLLKHRQEISQTAKDFADANFEKERYFEWEYDIATSWYEEEFCYTGTIEEWSDLDWPTKRRYLDGFGPPSSSLSRLDTNNNKFRNITDIPENPGELPENCEFFVFEDPLFWYNIPEENNLAYYWIIGDYPKMLGRFWNDAMGDDRSTLIWEGASRSLNEYRSLLGLEEY